MCHVIMNLTLRVCSHTPPGIKTGPITRPHFWSLPYCQDWSILQAPSYVWSSWQHGGSGRYLLRVVCSPIPLVTNLQNIPLMPSHATRILHYKWWQLLSIHTKLPTAVQSIPYNNYIVLSALRCLYTHWIKINRKVACHNLKHLLR
jgi:hypothetical protein